MELRRRLVVMKLHGSAQSRNPVGTPLARWAARSDRRRGFSLIEVLIAVGILLLVALGILPLFTRAMLSNVSGLESTRVSNQARSRLEELFQLPFNSPQLDVPGGSTELVVDQYYSPSTRQWESGTGAGVPAIFIRTTTIRQYGVTDLTTPLDGDAPAAAVHLKEIVISVRYAGDAAGPLEAPKRITARIMKAQ
jgi:prepilin-type N-terminal cleavage/methylation domain-containing protein